MEINNSLVKMMHEILKPVLVLSIALLTQTAVKAQSSKDSTLVIKTNIYCDHCLDCNDCGGKLVHDLSFEKGIKRNVVDPAKMTITITYSTSKTSPEELRKAISKMGYDADEMKADSAAYARLDGCCKKIQ